VVWDDTDVGGDQGVEPSAIESQVGAGLRAMAAGDWRSAREAFSAVLEIAEVPEAFFGLASALFWLGDLAGTIANCEKAYAGFRHRGDPVFAAGAALSLVGYNKDISAIRPRRADGCRVRHGSSRTRFLSCAGNSWGLLPT
jgi:hypothetical protein